MGCGSSLRIAPIELCGTLAWKARPRDHLVGQRAEREDVRPCVCRPRLDLLGGHVPGRAHDRASAVKRSGRPSQGRRRNRRRLPGQSEIEQLDAGLRQHHVAGLQVPLNHAATVGLVECVHDLDAVFERRGNGTAPRSRRCCSVSPSRCSITRYWTSPSFRRRTGCRCGGDSGGRRLRFALEAFPACWIARQMPGSVLTATVRSNACRGAR